MTDFSALHTQLLDLLTSQSLPTTTTISAPTIPPLPPTCLTLPSTSDLSTTTALLRTHILPYLNHSSLSPNYYGFIIGGTTPAALLADWLVAVYDQNVHVHLPADTVSTAVEAAALNLLVQLFRLPADEWAVGGPGRGGGVVTTGATASNVLGLAVGREWVVAEAARRRGKGEVSVARLGVLEACVAAGVTAVKVLSSMPHSSVVKAASVVGIGRESVIGIGKEGDSVELDVDRFEKLARAAEENGRVYILALSSGEVNTGRFATGGRETMVRLRRICDEYGVWMHVDGAFGLFGRVLMNIEDERRRSEYDEVIKGVEGLELADSITGDGHKLLNVPYDCGLFFTRHKGISEVVFGNGSAAYLTTDVTAVGGQREGEKLHAFVPGGEGDPRTSFIQSPINLGIENSRRFRALPVWTTLMTYGSNGYVRFLENQIGLARKTVEWMFDDERLDVLPQAASKEEAIGRTFMVVLFKARDEAVNKEIVKRINSTRRIYVSGTEWDGKPAARIAVSNWQVDVERDSILIKDVVSGCL